MCLPVATAITIATTLASVAGQIQQSQAAQAQASFQAAVARNNQIIAQRHAEDARLRGEQATAQISLREGRETAASALATRQLIARQRVAQAGLGQTTDVGSALDLTADTAAAGKLDTLTLRRNAAFERKVARNNAEREAIGFLTQGFNFEAEARLADLRRQSARNAGILSAFGTIATTASRVSDRLRNRVPTLTSFNPRDQGRLVPVGPFRPRPFFGGSAGDFEGVNF